MDEAALSIATQVCLDSAVYSQAEVHERLRALGLGDKTRLAKFAHAYAWKISDRSTDEDLLQEAFLRILNGTRKWPMNLAAVPFLVMVMQSIAWEWRNQTPSPPLQEHTEAIDYDPGAKIDEDRVFAILDSGLAGDPCAQRIVEDMRLGFSGAEVKKRSGLNDTAYASKMTKIRRYCEKLRRNLNAGS